MDGVLDAKRKRFLTQFRAVEDFLTIPRTELSRPTAPPVSGAGAAVEEVGVLLRALLLLPMLRGFSLAGDILAPFIATQPLIEDHDILAPLLEQKSSADDIKKPAPLPSLVETPRVPHRFTGILAQHQPSTAKNDAETESTIHSTPSPAATRKSSKTSAHGATTSSSSNNPPVEEQLLIESVSVSRASSKPASSFSDGGGGPDVYVGTGTPPGTPPSDGGGRPRRPPGGTSAAGGGPVSKNANKNGVNIPIRTNHQRGGTVGTSPVRAKRIAGLKIPGAGRGADVVEDRGPKMATVDGGGHYVLKDDTGTKLIPPRPGSARGTRLPPIEMPLR